MLHIFSLEGFCPNSAVGYLLHKNAFLCKSKYRQKILNLAVFIAEVHTKKDPDSEERSTGVCPFKQNPVRSYAESEFLYFYSASGSEIATPNLKN